MISTPPPSTDDAPTPPWITTAPPVAALPAPPEILTAPPVTRLETPAVRESAPPTPIPDPTTALMPPFELADESPLDSDKAPDDSAVEPPVDIVMDPLMPVDPAS